ncbi:hypothetical protein ABIA33_005637 [Streptacidiphilus sp. MAP12-16]|uniref:YrhB domain-containing protein n=1 Tax=Streptacidiphilus sp. MAP12-16 TaxID=3156300 RepID=UPI00351960BF
MITAERAREIANIFLAEEVNAQPQFEGITGEITRFDEHRFGWVFFYQSSTWVKTRDINDAWMGHGPVLIDRRDGSVHALGSARPEEDMARFQSRYDAETIQKDR